MESINFSQARNLIISARSKMVIARELDDAVMMREAQESAVNALGRLVVSTPMLADIVMTQFRTVQGANGEI
ncbi:hypothetical protein [Citrobacter portucalensis]|uniref:hypothetical protein n=1 Tax=Citrobacter portucalensis TaxID=1639133 RepID=UPI0018A39366|nr:hypothetical protein [Citrobacter portucalensis]BBV41360.1 hypothetical protein STW0522CIT26_28320 [Citrobacter portucalensis]BBV46341.1 hypothetical protein STW0522CIT27_27810 [Citrobacter portucalensis]BBV51623.1 hypothetical protein STW0522CIT30_28830 [Citrobacter portucalensis]BBW12355.1 hypothetical protein STN0717CIT27_28310 [Citrobacter portucalensis]BBW17407.1 hypothetical protein STN0717CIT36_28310 [Citrobacter portucalensis]